ncbi:sulfotransferase [Parafilimonas sp.]|uniref:sulfotransferase n=1 Tax=Parafilimonas sp. TaxID=1969739 RepID=UPI0039E71A9D
MEKNKKDFFILTAPRSGSTVLARTLDQHPQIFCAGEIFHPSGEIFHPEWQFPFIGEKNKKGLSRALFSVINYIKGYAAGAGHIKKFYNTRNAKAIRGFKLMNRHVTDFPTVWKYLLQSDKKVIVLVRKNIFREALSSFRARKIGIFHAGEDTLPAATKVTVNAAQLRQRVDELEVINSRIVNLGKNFNHIVLMYEEFENWQQMLCKIFGFLEVEEITMPAQLRKIGTANWREGVENYEEVENAMQDKYAHLIT